MAERDELLQREADGWTAVLDAVDRVPDELRTVEGVVPDWSVVDLVFHCGKWAELAGSHLEEMAAGAFTGEEQPQEVWQAMNASWAEESKTLTWEQAVAAAEAGRMQARTALEALAEVDETARSWFVEETIDHYAEHAQEIGRFAAGSA